MKYRSLVLLISLFWITEVECNDCGLDFVSGFFSCLAKYSNRSILCKEGNSHNPNVTSNATLPTYIDVSNPYLGQNGIINATIENNDPNYNSSYSFHVCVMRTFPALNWTLPISWCSFNQNSSILNITNQWRAITNLSVYVFTTDDSGMQYGCDYQDLTIKNCSDSLKVEVKLKQSDKFKHFQIGNVTINVRVKRNISSSFHSSSLIGEDNGCPANSTANNSLIESASGSANEGDSSAAGKDAKERNFQYTFYFPDKTHAREGSNFSSFSIDHYFGQAGNNSIVVEVLSITDTEVRYGKEIVHLVVYEPVVNQRISGSDKSYTGQQISFSVGAEGSTPIKVEWTIKFGDNSDATHFCERNHTILNTTQDETFHCTFNVTGLYTINATFKNFVSHENGDKDFTISQPPPINVVATSTSVVAILIVIIIVVIISIVLVGTYISYRKFRNKTTETANFSFVKLNRPSRWKRLSSQADKLKDRFGHKNKRFGLVNTADSGDNIDSFYGSLNPFAAHETL